MNPKYKILVTGGAGYIGSVGVKRLLDHGYEVVVIDNLSKGKEQQVDKRAEFFCCDLTDLEKLDEIFSKHDFAAVMHFAAAKDAGESMENPTPYTKNIISTGNLLICMDRYNCKKIVFSSSAAVYGSSKEENPSNYYGFSKLEGERILEWYRKIRGVQYVSLRYFNVAGDELGYIDPDAKNIFPIICEVIKGKREKLKIFGNDYETKDGTCIRDYIHVDDLIEAHIKALDLERSEVINLGTSKGYSVLDLVKVFEEVSNEKIPYEYVGRREGDPGCLVASCEKAKEVLGWIPKKTLKDMAESTLKAYEK